MLSVEPHMPISGLGDEGAGTEIRGWPEMASEGDALAFKIFQ